MPEHVRAPATRGIVPKLAATSFLVQLVTLYSSEFFNAAFNNRYDAMGLDFVGRLPYMFKPTVFLVFLAAYAFQLAVTLLTLRPLFSYFADGKRYDLARVAAIKLPWRIVITQASSWLLGTTAYYALRGWDSESGLPFALALSLKLAVGLAGSLFNCAVANIHLLPARRELAIVDVRPGENDRFARARQLFVVIATVANAAVHMFALAWYLSNPHVPSGALLPSVAAWGLWFVGSSVGLHAAVRFEYRAQVSFLRDRLESLAGAGGTGGKAWLLYFDEIGDLVDAFNRFSDRFGALIDQLRSSVDTVSSSAIELSATTREVTATSNMQAAAVKEVVSTMEDSDVITQSVGRSIAEVTRIALKTRENVDAGNAIVSATAGKMTEIRGKNADAISGIRALAARIRAVWDVVDIINAIVEQTRIIAFNAALEASTAGEAGRNFRVVAAEIQRLADSTSRSTAEIRERITEIQKAANNLIVVSEEGTERIRQGYELSDRLHSVFAEIMDSAEVSASSSESIERSIRQQAGASGQILVTMKEISRGIDSLVETQRQTARTAEELARTAEALGAQAAGFSRKAGEA